MEAEEAFRCVQLITTAYASARDGCRELPLPGLAALAGDDVTDRKLRQAEGRKRPCKRAIEGRLGCVTSTSPG